MQELLLRSSYIQSHDAQCAIHFTQKNPVSVTTNDKQWIAHILKSKLPSGKTAKSKMFYMRTLRNKQITYLQVL